MLWTSNLCVNREFFNKMGGLDERFTIAYEDVDFALRLKKQNAPSYFVYSAGVCHPWRTLRNEGKIGRKGISYSGIIDFLDKHPDQYPYHSASIFVKNALRGMLKELPIGIIELGGRGSLFKIYRIVQSLQSALAVKRWILSQNESL